MPLLSVRVRIRPRPVLLLLVSEGWLRQLADVLCEGTDRSKHLLWDHLAEACVFAGWRNVFPVHGPPGQVSGVNYWKPIFPGASVPDRLGQGSVDHHELRKALAPGPFGP